MNILALREVDVGGEGSSTGHMEVQTQRGIVTFVMFTDVLEDGDVEGNMLALDRKYN